MTLQLINDWNKQRHQGLDITTKLANAKPCEVCTQTIPAKSMAYTDGNGRFMHHDRTVCLNTTEDPVVLEAARRAIEAGRSQRKVAIPTANQRRFVKPPTEDDYQRFADRLNAQQSGAPPKATTRTNGSGGTTEPTVDDLRQQITRTVQKYVRVKNDYQDADWRPKGRQVCDVCGNRIYVRRARQHTDGRGWIHAISSDCVKHLRAKIDEMNKAVPNMRMKYSQSVAREQVKPGLRKKAYMLDEAEKTEADPYAAQKRRAKALPRNRKPSTAQNYAVEQSDPVQEYDNIIRLDFIDPRTAEVTSLQVQPEVPLLPAHTASVPRDIESDTWNHWRRFGFVLIGSMSDHRVYRVLGVVGDIHRLPWSMRLQSCTGKLEQITVRPTHLDAGTLHVNMNGQDEKVRFMKADGALMHLKNRRLKQARAKVREAQHKAQQNGDINDQWWPGHWTGSNTARAQFANLVQAVIRKHHPGIEVPGSTFALTHIFNASDLQDLDDRQLTRNQVIAQINAWADVQRSQWTPNTGWPAAHYTQDGDPVPNWPTPVKDHDAGSDRLSWTITHNEDGTAYHAIVQKTGLFNAELKAVLAKIQEQMERLGIHQPQSQQDLLRNVHPQGLSAIRYFSRPLLERVLDDLKTYGLDAVRAKHVGRGKLRILVHELQVRHYSSRESKRLFLECKPHRAYAPVGLLAQAGYDVKSLAHGDVLSFNHPVWITMRPPQDRERANLLMVARNMITAVDPYLVHASDDSTDTQSAA